MYLPRALQLCTPHLAVWSGESGKRYDFAVLRTGTVWIDEPAVYILARQDAGGINPLFVGETASLQLQFGGYRDRTAEEWRAAMASGMTHVHVRFDPISAEMRRAEVRDLIAALQPMVNVAVNEQSELGDAMQAAMALEQAEPAEALVGETETPTVRVPYRAGRLSPSRPSVEPGEPAPVQWLDEPTMPLWQFRADPAGEMRAEADLDAVPVTSAPLAFDSHTPSMRGHDTTLPSAVEVAAERHPEVIGQDAEVSVADTASVSPVLETAEVPFEEPAAARPERTGVAPATPPVAASGRRRGSLLTRLLRLVIGRRELPSALQADETETPVRSPAEAAAADRPDAPVTVLSATKELIAPTAGFAKTPLEQEPAVASRIDVVQMEIRETRAIDVDVGGDVDTSETRFEVVDVTRAELIRTDAAQAEAIREDAMSAAARVAEAAAAAAAASAPVAGAVEIPAAEVSLSNAERARARLPMAKQALALDPTSPVVLFAGDIGWHGGADILFEAMLIVCAGHQGVQFVYAGDGALRGELRDRASRGTVGSRCRFLGDVPAGQFPEILAAADFVAIPARSPQDEGLARAALAQGKPVLATHQAAIGCIVHGRNGLVTYDNPGSFVWGVRELLGPLYGDLLRQIDRAA